MAIDNYKSIIDNITTNDGHNLSVLSEDKPVLLVFLRHFGCIFCREALDDLSKMKNELDKTNTQLVMVHMAENQIAEKYFDKFGIKEVLHISDKECNLYKQFGLMRGTFSQLFGFKTWLRGAQETLKRGTNYGQQLGDGFQMPGVFVIYKGEVKASFIHKIVSDKPDYLMLANCSID